MRRTADQPPAAASSDAAVQEPADAGWFGWLRRLFGQAAPAAPAPSADPPPAGQTSAARTSAAQATGAQPAAVLPAASAAAVAGGAPRDAEAALTALVAETLTAVQPAMAVARADGGDAAAAMTPRAALAGRSEPEAAAVRDPAPAAGPLQSAAADQIGQTPAASGGDAPAPPRPGDVGIAIGDGEVAIEGGAPATAGFRAAPTPSADRAPAVGLPAAKPAAAGPSAVRTAAAGPSVAGTLVGRIAFAPQSAALPIGIGPQLQQVLAAARAQGARIRIVGEAGAEAGALALDRARAVALALVRLGAGAQELEMTLARHATGDQASLLLATGPR